MNKFIPATKVMGINLFMPSSDENKFIPATTGDNNFVLATTAANKFIPGIKASANKFTLANECNE